MSNKNKSCGATPERVEVVKSLASFHRSESDRLGKKTTGAKPWNQKYSKVHGAKADALEAILAEREELLRDKARLDWIDGMVEPYGFEDIHEGNRWVLDGPFRNLRIAIDAAMKGEG